MELQCALDKQVHWWCDSPPKSRDIVKDLRRNILLRHQKVDWSEDLTTEFILLRGSRLQILLFSHLAGFLNPNPASVPNPNPV